MFSDYGTFAHLTADKVELYRAVLDVFRDAKTRFVLHLRPSEVAAAAPGSPPTEEVEAALRQLVNWGNLSADPDTADVRTIEEFYRARFLYRLTSAGESAERALAVFEEERIERLLDAAAEREISDALDPTEEQKARARQTWRARWTGLVGWFLPSEGRQAQAEILRARARSAIPALLQAIAEVNERRLSRSDRASDLRRLARWFAACDSDADAHRLWRAAFALAPARHLLVDEDTLAAREQRPVPPSTSWLDAPPVRVSPRLRRTGRYVRRGRPDGIVDRSAEKALLGRLAAEEAAQISAARARLTAVEATRLSDLGTLDPLEFELFLDLLGSVLAGAVGNGALVRATSSDGALEIDLIPAEDGALAEIATRDGVLTGPDHHVVIRESFGAGV